MAKFGTIPTLWMILALGIGRLFPALELHTQSLFWRLRPPQAPLQEIILIAIDELSLTQGENYHSDPDRLSFYAPIQQYPWKREAYALVIERLMEAGARVVALDVLFANPSLYGAGDDRILGETLLKYQDRLVLASSYEVSASQEGIVERRISPRDLFLQLDPRVEGFVNLAPDRDGNIHRLPVLAPEVTFIDAIVTQGKISIKPPQGEGINYLGRANTWVRAQQQYPFYFLLNPKTWADVLENGAVFRDKIVLIGATAPSLQDIQPSPLGTMPGVEIHAHALATLLTNRSVRFWLSPWFVLAWLLLCSGLLRSIQKSQYRFGGAIALAALATIGSLLVWQNLNILLPIGRMVLGTVGMGTTYLIGGVIEEQMGRQKLRRTLEVYVAAPIVAEILNQPESYYELLTGKSVQAAVMFSDIRGFTSLSQVLPPQTLISLLNEYLTAMVEAIIAHQGTVDKFMGDAIMAEFGSPLSRGAENDVLAALKATLGMRAALYHLREAWRRSGQIPLFHGIGLHYGEIIVGNIGSPQRLEYAAIGDTVNTASRIEGLTKQLGYDILISEAVYRIAQEQIDVIDLGQHQLRGRSTPIGIYALVGLKGQTNQLFEQVQKEWHQYHATP
ncbi:MAG: adenylate/guanylate cyclase domain-containing protein [Cyanobacteria bacterium KgW148]|nr:adenylate/guanylate cyclase domain-containing protein [Cyanobacteria bacterium KgW148]